MVEPGNVIEETSQPVLMPDRAVPPPATVSPFANPDYGRDGERSGHVIRSHAHWKLEETQSLWTGAASACVVLAGAIMLAFWRRDPYTLEFLHTWLNANAPGALARLDAHSLAKLLLYEGLWQYRVALLPILAFAAMAAVEIFHAKVHRRHFDFTAPRAVDRAAWRRIFLRTAVLAGCFMLAYLAYGFLGVYRFFNFPYPSGWYFAPFHSFFILIAMPAVLGSVPYFWMVERYARPDGPCDELLILGLCLCRAAKGCFHPGLRGDARSALCNLHVRNMLLGLAVKFFFVPLMLVWTVYGWHHFETLAQGLIAGFHSRAWASSADVALNFRSLHELLVQFIFAAELTTALAAYCASMRLLDTQVTSAEPTFFGWMIALCCYPPFVQATSAYLWRHAPDTFAADFTSAYPVLAMTGSMFVLSLLGIYASCTFCFGLRFSNLTNRGILCKGPYKYVRHPAYACKNAAWMLLILPAIPFHPLAALVYGVRTLLTAGIYCLRAITEERHLIREAHYREYCQKVPWRFIPGVW